MWKLYFGDEPCVIPFVNRSRTQNSRTEELRARGQLPITGPCAHSDSGFFLTAPNAANDQTGNKCFISREFSEHELMTEFTWESVESVWKIGNFANLKSKRIKSCVIPGPRDTKWQVLVENEKVEQNGQSNEVVSIFAALLAKSAETTSATVCFQLETGIVKSGRSGTFSERHDAVRQYVCSCSPKILALFECEDRCH